MDDEPLLDSVLTHMGSMYTTLGKFESSMHVYKRALGIIQEKYGKCIPLILIIQRLYIACYLWHLTTSNIATYNIGRVLRFSV